MARNPYRAVAAACLVLSGVGFALGGLQSGAIATPTPDEDRQAIRAHLDRIFKAYIAKDRPEIEATHDRAWRGFLTNSPRIIRGIDEYMRAADATLESPSRLVGYTMEELDVQFRGPDVAIVPYVAELEGEREGARHRWRLRVIDVYERQGGEWMQIASNTAMHPHSTFERASEPQPMLPSERAALLKVREGVWRAWFAGDEETLRKVLPQETLALSPGADGWAARDAIIRSSLDSAKGGTTLVSLEFPRTDIQSYGATAILYTSYAYTTDARGKRSTERGKAIEVFVQRRDGWVNTGWQLSPDSH